MMEKNMSWPKVSPSKYCVSLELIMCIWIGEYMNKSVNARALVHQIHFIFLFHFARFFADFINSHNSQHQCHQFAQQPKKNNNRDYFLLTHGSFQWLIVREICVLICSCCFLIFFGFCSHSFNLFHFFCSFTTLTLSSVCVSLNHSIRFSDFISQIRVISFVPNWCVLSFNLIIANEMNGVVNLFFILYIHIYYTMRLPLAIIVLARFALSTLSSKTRKI